MATRRTLRERGVTRTKVDMDDLVGQVLAIRRVSIGESFNYDAPFVELQVDVLDDPESGVVSDADVVVVSFGKAIVRTLEDWLENGEVGQPLDPPLVVRLAKEGRTHVLQDVDEPPAEPEAGTDDLPF